MSFLELLAMLGYLEPALTDWLALKNAKTTTLWQTTEFLYPLTGKITIKGVFDR